MVTAAETVQSGSAPIGFPRKVSIRTSLHAAPRSTRACLLCATHPPPHLVSTRACLLCAPHPQPRLASTRTCLLCAPHPPPHLASTRACLLCAPHPQPRSGERVQPTAKPWVKAPTARQAPEGRKKITHPHEARGRVAPRPMNERGHDVAARSNKGRFAVHETYPRVSLSPAKGQTGIENAGLAGNGRVIYTHGLP